MSVPSHQPVSTLHSVQSVSVIEWWRGNITVLWVWVDVCVEVDRIDSSREIETLFGVHNFKTYSYPRVTYSDPKVTYSYPTLLGGGGWVTTNFNVSFELFRLEGHPLPILAWASQLSTVFCLGSFWSPGLLWRQNNIQIHLNCRKEF